MLAANGTINAGGTLSSIDSKYIWAFGLGSYGYNPENFIIGNNYAGGDIARFTHDGHIFLSGLFSSTSSTGATSSGIIAVDNAGKLFNTGLDYLTITGGTDTFVTGFTYDNANKFIIANSTGGTLSAIINSVTGLTVSGLLVSNVQHVSGNLHTNNIIPYTAGIINIGSALYGTNIQGSSTFNDLVGDAILSTTLSAGTIFSGSTNIGTLFGSQTQQAILTNQILTKANLSGATFTGSINAGVLSATTLSASTFYSGSTNLYSIFKSSPDVFVTGGTYNNSGSTIFANSTGGTFIVVGYFTGGTDVYETGFTYNNSNKFTISNNTGGTLSATINTVTGLTVNGNLIVTGSVQINNPVINLFKFYNFI